MNNSPFAVRMPQSAVVMVPLAMGLGVVLVWAGNTLEGQWLMAVVMGLTLFCIAIATGHFERFLLGLLILSLPLNVDVRFGLVGYTEPDAMRISAIDMILFGLYVGWVARLVVKGDSLRSLWPHGATPLACLIGWSALSVINSLDPSSSMMYLLGTVRALLCYIYVANHVKTRNDLRLFVGCLIVGLFLESVIACVQAATGSTLGLTALGESRKLVALQLGLTEVSRVVGTLGHPNPLGRYLAEVLPLVLALNLAGVRWRWRTRMVIAGASLLGTIALVLTLSRSAWVGMGVASFALLVWVLVHRRMRVRPVSVMLGAVAIALVLMFFGSLISSRWTESDEGTAASRIPQMRVAWSMITHHPILGVGLRNYTKVMRRYDTTAEGMSFRYYHTVHNMPLLLAAEVGVMGVVWFGWFLWTVARRGWQKIAAADDVLTRWVLLGIAGGVLAHLTIGMVEPMSPSRDNLFMIFTAILVAHGHGQRTTARDRLVNGSAS